MKRTFNPFFLILLAVLVFNPLGFNIFELPKLHFLAGFFAISLVYIIIEFLRKGEFSFPFNKYVYGFLGVWLVSLILSTIFSVAPELSFWGSYNRVLGLYSHFIFIGIFVIFLGIFKDKDKVKSFFIFLCLIAAITSIIAILQQFGFYGMSENLDTNEYVGRSFSTLGHPSFFGQFLLLPIWAGLYLSFDKEQKNRKYFVPLVFLLILCLLLSENRASLLGLMISVSILVLILGKIKKSYKIAVVFGAIATFFAYIFIYASSLRSLGSRYYLWEGAIKSFLDKPLLGSGLETFEIAFQKHFPIKLYYFEHLYALPDRAHNEWLNILVTQGILGFIAYGLIIFGIFYLLFKKRKALQKNKILLFSTLAFISILISNFFSFPVTIHYLIFAALLAIILNNLLDVKDYKVRLNTIFVLVAGSLVIISTWIIYNSVISIHSDTLFAKGHSVLTTAKVNDGMEDIQKSLELNPHQGDLFLYFGDTLKKAGTEFSDPEILEYSEYVNSFGRKFFNDDFRSTYYYAKIFQAQGRIAEADYAYFKAKELAPKNAGILRDLAKFYYENEEYGKANQIFEEFFQTIPDYWRISEKELSTLDAETEQKHRLFFKHAPDIWDLQDMYLHSQAKSIEQPTTANFPEASVCLEKA
ncbi:hypothetical protein GF354_01435 [Candidatus Peregrinibacteria bacterium]|nr:hypothetical protein [Candidatus Peregrinibacteria bacterium]